MTGPDAGGSSFTQYPDVHVAFTKYDGGPHWQHDSRYLGQDEHGHWIGCPRGQYLSRPGRELTLGFPSVLLAPPDALWVAAFNADAAPGVRAGCEIYIDVTGPVGWSPDLRQVTMVDLDLDVLRLWDGSVAVDDEDEFEDHRVRFGYPAEVVTAARRTCAERVTALQAGDEPFVTVFRSWLAHIS